MLLKAKQVKVWPCPSCLPSMVQATAEHKILGDQLSAAIHSTKAAHFHPCPVPQSALTCQV